MKNMTYFEVLQNIMAIGNDIDYAAQALGMSDFCPSFRQKQNECDPLCLTASRRLLDCIKAFVGAVKMCGATDLLIMASVVSGLGEKD